MPAYNFMKRWVPQILDGSKGQTIRRRRKRPTVPEDVLSLYTGMRTKACRPIALTVCKDVIPIEINIEREEIYWLGHPSGWVYRLERGETLAIAIDDGFSSSDELFSFFTRYKKPVLDDFEIIQWDIERFWNLWDFKYEMLGLDAEKRMDIFKIMLDLKKYKNFWRYLTNG